MAKSNNPLLQVEEADNIRDANMVRLQKGGRPYQKINILSSQSRLGGEASFAFQENNDASFPIKVGRRSIFCFSENTDPTKNSQRGEVCWSQSLHL